MNLGGIVSCDSDFTYTVQGFFPFHFCARTYRMGILEWKNNPSFIRSGVLEGEWKKIVARIGWVMAIRKKGWLYQSEVDYIFEYTGL